MKFHQLLVFWDNLVKFVIPHVKVFPTLILQPWSKRLRTLEEIKREDALCWFNFNLFLFLYFSTRERLNLKVEHRLALLPTFPLGWFPLSRNFYVRTCVKFTFANKIEAMHKRSLVSVKVEPRSTSRLSSALFILPLFFFLRDLNLRALTCVAKNASV